MAVVKAGGYGHGMVPAARAALAGGASWLGVADLAEAVTLRQAGITAPVLCLMAFGDPAEAIRHDVDVTAGSVAFAAKIAAAADRAGVRARLHLKADTGLSRGGAPPADWPGLVEAALDAQARGSVQVVGLWSHFACADIPGHPSVAAQLAAFADAVAFAEKAGVTPEVRHIANTAAGLTVPESRLDLVRFGGAVYGLSTLPGGAPSWLRPAMTLRARLAMVKRVPAGTGVSYGHRYVTSRETTLGLVPLGYADGVPRAPRPACRWSARAAAAGRSRARSAWISSSSTSATSRWRRAMRWCCSARGTTASPPRRSGARHSAPSRMRSPPASGPGSRGPIQAVPGHDPERAGVRAPDHADRHRRGDA